MQVISRAEAKAQGLKRYYTGKPCKHGHSSERYSRDGKCVACVLERDKRYRDKNKQRISESLKRWRDKNKELVREKDRRYYEKNRELIKDRARRHYRENRGRALEANATYREENREQIAATKRRYREANKEKIAAAKRRWRESNRDRLLENHKRRNSERYAVDPNFRLVKSMREMVRRTALNKTDRTHKLLGYTAAELREHLEKQFLPGMSWCNHGHGGWHIDHIVSIKQMLDEGITDVAVINSLANLRPMWAKDNMAKGSESQFLL